MKMLNKALIYIIIFALIFFIVSSSGYFLFIFNKYDKRLHKYFDAINSYHSITLSKVKPLEENCIFPVLNNICLFGKFYTVELSGNKRLVYLTLEESISNVGNYEFYSSDRFKYIIFSKRFLNWINHDNLRSHHLNAFFEFEKKLFEFEFLKFISICFAIFFSLNCIVVFKKNRNKIK